MHLRHRQGRLRGGLGARRRGHQGAERRQEHRRRRAQRLGLVGLRRLHGPDEASKKLLTIGKPKAYTTTSGIKGSVATTYSSGVPKKDKCDTDGKATTFAFKNSADDFVSWTFYGAKGVSEEVPDATVQKILARYGCMVSRRGEPGRGGPAVAQGVALTPDRVPRSADAEGAVGRLG